MSKKYDMPRVPLKNHEELMDFGSKSVALFSTKYNMDTKDLRLLVDLIKIIAAEYHRLVDEGKIPEDKRYVAR